jgi:inosine-uridine nucleoside N-ribohydrolase
MKYAKKWLAALVVGCSVAATCNAQDVIFDCDAAVDDAMALMLLGSDKSVHLKAITVAGTGEAHGLAGAKNMSSILQMMNASDVPVAFGRPSPLSNAGRPFPDFMRMATDNLLVGKPVPPFVHAAIGDNAVELMGNVVAANKGKITILATGPVTNVAEFVKRYPHLKNKIERIVIMGGAVTVPGNVQAVLPKSSNAFSELNFYADPEAVREVFASGVPVTLVALDATNQVPMTQQFYEGVAAEQQPDLRLTTALLDDIVKIFGMKTFMREFYLWDPLAAMIMLDPKMADIQSMPLMVNAKDGSLKLAKKGENATGNIDVVTTIHTPEKVLSNYTAMLKSSHIYAQHRFYFDAGRIAAQSNVKRIGSYRYA